MQNLSISLKKLTANIMDAAQRFSVPVFLCLLFFVTTIGGLVADETMRAYSASMFCGVYWFIALRLFAESRKWDEKYYYTIGTPVFFAIAWLFYTTPNMWVPLGFMGTGLFLSIFIAPFLHKKSSSSHIWEFQNRLSAHICLTVLAAILLYLGIIAILASISFLFSVKFYSALYFQIWLLVATVFSPIFAMAGIPKKFDIKKGDYPQSTRVILAYIALPLLLIYAIILYAYIAKILLLWNLPKGGVAYMVSAFGFAGMLAYLASYPLMGDKGIIGLFGRNFFKILIAPLVLLAIGIGTRIQKYGVTEERYAVVICLICLSFSAFIAIGKYKKEAPKYILMCVVALLLIASFGPLGAVNISAQSQFHRLENLLEKNHILVNGKIKKPAQTLSNTESRDISSIITYMVKTQKTYLIRPWFTDMPEANINNHDSTPDAAAITRDMGVAYAQSYRYRNDDDSDGDNNNTESNNFRSFNMHSNWWKQEYTDIAGYDYLVKIDSFYKNGSPGFTREIKPKNSGMTLFVSFIPERNLYSVSIQNTEQEIIFKLEEPVKQWSDKGIPASGPLILEGKSKNLAVRLIITNIAGKFDNYTAKPNITYLDSILLIQIK